MRKEFIYEGTLLQDKTVTYTLTELREICVVEEKVLLEMVEFGILEPKEKRQQIWIFNANALDRTQKAMRLHHDLAINWAGISLILDLLEEIHELRQLAQLLQDKENQAG